MQTPAENSIAVKIESLGTESIWKRGLFNFVKFCRQKPLGAFGIVMIITLCMSAILAPWISPYDPKIPYADYVWMGPNAKFWFGNDQIGRDILSRILWGGRISLFVGLTSVAFGITIGSLLGIVSAYFGGKFDLAVQRVVDSLLAFPAIILALALLAGLGQSVQNVILALVVIFIPGATRTIRSQALAIKEMDYVLAARAIGASQLRIILLYMAPNCFGIFLVLFTITVGFAIVVESSLSFLGLGVPPDVPTWGKMLADAGRTDLESTPWQSIFPGAAISLTVFAVNFLGDALRDVLDPRLRGTR